MAKELTVKKTETPTPWRPFTDLDRWERDAQRMMDQFFGRPFMSWWPERWLRTEPTEIGAPSVDVYVDQGDIVIKAELPGMEKDDIQVQLSNHALTLKGEKKREEKIKDEDYIYSERVYGSFSRTLELPWDVQGEKVKASFKNGVLEIRLSVAETAKAKTIKVKIEEGPTTTIGQD
ncbi:MAG TPA: Hsp20/alpha crystallin family protein [Terriglobales bacterium]|jgi:HSP20 family protein|nr:Hsp20/alpha crystallin family protein [Terriglobales bacterium]